MLAHLRVVFFSLKFAGCGLAIFFGCVEKSGISGADHLDFIACAFFCHRNSKLGPPYNENPSFKSIDPSAQFAIAGSKM